MSNYISDDINISSDNSDGKKFDYSDKGNYNKLVKFASKYKKLPLVEIRVNLFIFGLGLKSLLCRQNQQTFRVMKTVVILRLVSSHLRV